MSQNLNPLSNKMSQEICEMAQHFNLVVREHFHMILETNLSFIPNPFHCFGSCDVP